MANNNNDIDVIGGITEIRPEFLSSSAHNPFVMHDSPSRSVMDSSHMASRISLITPERKQTCMTGLEYEFGKYIDQPKVPYDCIVKTVIPRAPGLSEHNPEVILVVEREVETDEGTIDLMYDVVEVPFQKANNTYFGYTLEETDALRDTQFNNVLPAGTVLAKAASYAEDGSYMYGVNANVVYASHLATAEDGFAVREGWLDSIRYMTHTVNTVFLDRDDIPVNLYGDQEHFKMFPDVGERVRDGGLLLATRKRRPFSSITDLNYKAICEVDHLFDNPIYVPEDSIVVDIRVQKGNGREVFSPLMVAQIEKYYQMELSYAERIVTSYRNLMRAAARDYGDGYTPKLSPKYINIVRDAMIRQAVHQNKRRVSMNRREIEQYRIEITTMSVRDAGRGVKLADLDGGKGVIVHTYSDEDAPRDDFGNIVDILTDGVSATIARMNPGRILQAFTGSLSRDNRQQIIDRLKAKHGQDYLFNIDTEDVERETAFLRSLYSKINNKMVEYIDSLDADGRYEHLLKVVEDWLDIYWPVDNDRSFSDMMYAVNDSEHKAPLGKLNFKDTFGRWRRTIDDIRIERNYFLTLDKPARDFSGVSSARVNQYMLPIKGGQYDKYRYPHSRTPIADVSETEGRIAISHTDPVYTAEKFDVALNPTAHMAIVRNDLNSEVMYDVDFSIDREAIPYGKTKPLLLMNHMFGSSGLHFVYRQYSVSNDDALYEEEPILNRPSPLLATMYQIEPLDIVPIMDHEGEYKLVSKLGARDILNMSRDQVWSMKFGYYEVVFEDGVTLECSLMSIILDRYLWELYKQHPTLPIISKTSTTGMVGDGFFNGKVFSNVLETIFQHACDTLGIRHYEEKEPMLKLCFEILQTIFNEVLHNIQEFMTTLRAEHLYEIIDDPQVVAIQSKITGTPDSIGRSYRELTQFYFEKETYNPLTSGVRYGAASVSQTNQVIGSPGFISDLNRLVYPKPVFTGYGEGIKLVYDLLIISLMAVKAHNASSQSIQDTEWASRRFQQLAMSVERAILGDCGSTIYDTIDAFDIKYLNNYLGIWYVEDRDNPVLKCITKEDVHLAGKTIHIRNAFGCILPNRHNICTTCLGKTYENFKPNTNIGYTAAAGHMRTVSQTALSFKHLVESVAGSVIKLVGEVANFFKAGEGNLLYINDNFNFEDYSIVLDGNDLIKLTDAIQVTDSDLSMSRMGDIEEVTLRRDDGKHEVSVRVAYKDREANITTKFLDYIKENDFETDRRGNYSIPLKNWEIDEPMFEIPLKDEDIAQFLRLLESYVEGTINKKDRTFKQHFDEFVKLVFDTGGTNISTLYVLGYALTVSDYDNGDFRQARGSDNKHYAKASEIFNNRCLSQFLVYQAQINPLFRQSHALFSKRNKQRHPMRVLFFPEETVAETRSIIE